MAVTHGGYSPKVYEPEAAAIIDDVLSDPEAAHLARPMFREQLETYATMQARQKLISRHLDTMTASEMLTPPKGGSNTPLESWRAVAEGSVRVADKLGLTPTSAARLGRDVASAQVDMARILPHIDELPEDGQEAPGPD